jgi:hypothetical protein
MWINVMSSTVTTVLLIVAMIRSRHRAFLIFAALLAASAVASFAYVKDEIMSVAGVFYAVAVFWAVRDLLTRPLHAAAAVVTSLALLAAGSGWAVRTVGVQHVLRQQAFTVHNDWAAIPESMEQRGTWPADAPAQHLILTLRDQALRKKVVNPWFMARWSDRVFEGDY